MTDSINIALSGIAVPERLRALRPENVDAIAESMSAQGQLQDVLLRRCPGHGYWLIAGQHRLEAARKLGWDAIRCTILEDISADEAELIEIDENLIRAELTPAETALHIARRKELYEKLHGQNHGGNRRSSSPKENLKSFVIETARKTRQGRSTVARVATRGRKVKVLADITGTSLDKAGELDALAKMSESDQRALADRAKNGENVSAVKTLKPRTEDDTPVLRCAGKVEKAIKKCLDEIERDQYGKLFAVLHAVIDDFERRT